VWQRLQARLQFLRTLWWAPPLAALWTLFIATYGPEGGWSAFALASTFLPALVMVGWFSDQVSRVKSDADVRRVADRLQDLLDELDRRTQDIIGHTTGGESVPYGACLTIRWERTAHE
jgi:hypothetical protein